MHKPITFGAASALLVLTALPANATVTKTWVSSTGADSGTCQLVAPCKTFQFAHDQTSVGGEIDVKDSGSYGPLSITKSISIVADGAIASVGLSTDSNGILIYAPQSVIVLRGLKIDGHNAGNTGISVSAAGTLTVDNCLIQNWGRGISTYSGDIFVVNSAIIGNTILGIVGSPYGGGFVYISNDTIVGNNDGVSQVVYSYGNNVINGNKYDVDGTLLPAPLR